MQEATEAIERDLVIDSSYTVQRVAQEEKLSATLNTRLSAMESQFFDHSMCFYTSDLIMPVKRMEDTMSTLVDSQQKQQALMTQLATAKSEPSSPSVKEWEKTLNKVVKEGFANTLVPAYEQATRVMFTQMEQAFRRGIDECTLYTLCLLMSSVEWDSKIRQIFA
jgi:hypothetical protein